MKNEIVKFKTAELAKEKGFDWGAEDIWIGKKEGESYIYTVQYYDSYFSNNNSDDIYSIDLKNEESYSAPTQPLLQRWLREKHNIHVEVLLTENTPYNTFYYRIMQIGKYFSLSYDDNFFETYEDSLEAGLQEALKLIRNG